MCFLLDGSNGRGNNSQLLGSHPQALIDSPNHLGTRLPTWFCGNIRRHGTSSSSTYLLNSRKRAVCDKNLVGGTDLTYLFLVPFALIAISIPSGIVLLGT